jgi:hypothetical protein
LRFCGVHIGDPPPNQATTFESQQIQEIQYVFGQTLSPDTFPLSVQWSSKHHSQKLVASRCGDPRAVISLSVVLVKELR